MRLAIAMSTMMIVLLVPSILTAESTGTDLTSPATPGPDIIEGAGVSAVDGSLDLTPPPLAHFIRNKQGSFRFRLGFRFEDRSATRCLLAAASMKIWRERGDYGSTRWQLICSRRTEAGDRHRNPRLRDYTRGPLDSSLITQVKPVVRYRLEIMGSSHGVKSRTKRLGAVVVCVLEPPTGHRETAPTLLLCREAWLVYTNFKEFFGQLRRRRMNRRLAARALEKMHNILCRIDGYGSVLPESSPLDFNVAWGLSLRRKVRLSTGIPRLNRLDRLASYGRVSQGMLANVLRGLRDDIPHDDAILACERAIKALENYGYKGTITAANLRYELDETEKVLLTGSDSYDHRIDQARRLFNKMTGHQSWSTGSEPKQRSLKRTFAKAERLFNVPRFVAGLQVSALRALCGVKNL